MQPCHIPLNDAISSELPRLQYHFAVEQGRLRLCSICRKESEGKKVWSTQNSKLSFIWSRHFCGGCKDICQLLMVQWSGNLVLHQNLRHNGEELLRLCSGGKCSPLCMYAALVTETNTSAVLAPKMRLQCRMQRVKLNFEYTFFANEHIMLSLLAYALFPSAGAAAARSNDLQHLCICTISICLRLIVFCLFCIIKLLVNLT